MINGEKLVGCSKKILILCDYLDAYARRMNSELVITSGKRSGDGTSWHDNGLAVDFNFRSVHSFKLVTQLFNEFLNPRPKSAFEGATEFEVCSQNLLKHHIHVAFGNESAKDVFTGVYV